MTTNMGGESFRAVAVLAVAQYSSDHGMAKDEWPGFDFEGWTFAFRDPSELRDGTNEMTYSDGVLYGDILSSGFVTISKEALSELIQWGSIDIVSGDCCPLTKLLCPQCQKEEWLGNDYICWKCRKAATAKPEDAEA